MSPRIRQLVGCVSLLFVSALPARAASVQVHGDGQAGVIGPMQLARASDEVPLPIAATTAAYDGGDRVLAAASGDPHFLGFVAGAYFPPVGERIDPELLASIQTSYDDDRSAAETYAFVMFGKRITPERIVELEALGCRPLGFHPHHTLKVALPVLALEQVAALDFVRWVGLAKSWQKVHTHLSTALAQAPAGELVDVWINVFDSDLCPASSVSTVGAASVADLGVVGGNAGASARAGEVWMSNGWQQRALEALGAQVTEYVDSVRAFRARIAPASIEQLVALDFVQFIEADVAATPHHDESTPLTALDYGRAFYDGGSNILAPVGEIDSGVDVGHEMLNHIYAVGWDTTIENDPWFDDCAHGTHVAGTILGLPGAGNIGLTGAAPGCGNTPIRRFRNVKRFYDSGCTSSAASSSTLFSYMRNVYVDGLGFVSPRPFVVNNSWGSDPGGTPWIGSESSARTLDDEVYDNDQLYVFSAGNAGSAASSMGLPACAKNAFTVGAVIDYQTVFEGDPGSARSSSSRGPCGDGRWKPNVAAPGRQIRSADAETGSGYVDKSGTSMAAPHVTGLAAQLFDHHAFLSYEPARAASLIMATAMTHEDLALSQPSSDPLHHLNIFGAGRINSARANFTFGGNGWINWGYSLASDSWAFGDFDVPASCTRIVVVMTYFEESASAGASQALVNDIDLWIDGPQSGINPSGNSGEYFAHQSTIDNTEIRFINNPPVGSWRWKTWSEDTTSTSKVGVTVVFVYDDTTPNGSLSLTANDTFVQPNDDVSITATATNPEFFASCVFLDSSSTGDALQASSTVLEDGITTDLIDNQHLGRDVLLGTLRPNTNRSATWTTRWATEGVKNWSVDARSDNWVDQSDSIAITVDGTNPGLATNLASPTHTPSVWSNVANIQYTWTAATDNLSGVDGYGVFTSPNVAGAPASSKDIEQVTSYSEPLAEGSWYFKLRTLDNCGNWSASYAWAGPYQIDLTAPTAPGALSSPTHTPNVLSCATSVTVNWNAATDALSGLAGYAGVWNTAAATIPAGALNIAANATSYATDIGSSASARYFHLRPRDIAGNWGTTQHFGPVLANSNTVLTYCTGKTNSLGCVPSIGSTNAPSKSAGNFLVTCSQVRNNKNGLFFWGTGPLANPFQGGTLCVQAPTVRTPVQASGGSLPPFDNCTGTYTFAFDTLYMNVNGVDPGDVLYAQCWMRDPDSPSTTGLSNALQFTVCE